MKLVLPSICTWRTALWPLALLGLGAHAQTSASRPAPEAEVVELSAFSVTTDAENSYIASESVTGSRVAVKIQDLPYHVNVITNEFLTDFAYFEIGDDLGYTSSLNGLDQGGGYNMRGYGATTMLRNGFFRLGLVDRVNVDRIEVIKGPSAAIYGQTTPGGLMNVITKRPKNRREQRLSLTLGDYDTLRVEANSTGPIGLGGRTSYVFSGSYYERGYDMAFSKIRTKTMSLAVQHKFTETSNLVLELEWLNRATTPNLTTPLINVPTNPATSRFVGIAMDLKNFNQNGPVSENNREISSANLTYENKLSPTWSLRLAGNFFTRHLWNFNSGAASSFNPATRLITGRNPARGVINEDGGGFQADLLAHYWMFNRKLENKTLFTLDYSTYWRYDPTRNLPTAIRNDPNQFRVNQSVDNPDYRIPGIDTGLWTSLSRKNKNRTDVTGAFLRHQTAALNGRLIAIAGLRYDFVKFKLRDLLNNVEASYDVDAITPMIGANFKLTPNVAVYANRSESFTPQSQSASALNLLPNEEAEGYDYGFKVGLFEDRLQFTLGGYSIVREGIRVTDIDESGVQVVRGAGTQEADGVEFDFTWRATNELTLLGGIGYVDARTTENGRDRDSIGRRPARVPEVNFGLAVKYTVASGLLKGLGLNLGGRYVGEVYTDPLGGGIVEPATIGGVPNPNAGLILSHGGQRDITVPSYFLLDGGVSYRFRPQDSKASHQIGLNVKNLLDKEGIDVRRFALDRRSFFLGYTLRY